MPKAFLPLSVDDGRTTSVIERLIRQAEYELKPTEIVVVGNDHPWFVKLEERSERILITRAEPIGELEAVARGMEMLTEDSDFVVIVSCDNVFEDGTLRSLFRAAVDVALDAVGCSYVPTSRGLCMLETSPDGFVTQLREKPARETPGLAKAGLYALTSSSAARLVAPPWRTDRFAEFSMTEAIRRLVLARIAIRAHVLPQPFVDIGTYAGYALAVESLTRSQK